jgi:hypothetical protein
VTRDDDAVGGEV